MMHLATLLPFLPLIAASPLSSLPLNAHRASLAPLVTPPLVPGSPPSLEPHLFGGGKESHIVKDSYIVRLRHTADVQEHHEIVQSFHEADRELRMALKSGGEGFEETDDHLTGIQHRYEIHEFKGYSGKFSAAVRDAIRALPEVEWVEKDSRVWTTELENGAPWGLARISHRKSLGFGTFNKYLYEKEGGEGVDAYVVDTGVNINHVEFEGRAAWGKTIPQNDVDADGNGHGTHVAGTIASAKYGVAKKANIIAVKVLGSGGSGTMADVIGGVAWAATSALNKAKEEAKKSGSKFKGSVANMSLGGGKSPGLNDAVRNAVKSGLHFAVAAGNENADACNTSPASTEEAVTVGASTIADDKAYFSNHGPCVDIQAPGLNILSTWNTGNNSVNTISGTSMASPHVAGALAYFLSLYPETFQPSEEDYKMAGVERPVGLNEVWQEMGMEKVEVVWSIRKGGQVLVGKMVEWIKGGKVEKALGEKSLDPKVLKQALIRTGTEGILKGLPAKTINVLLFNNYTASR